MKICDIFLLQLLAFVAVIKNTDSCSLEVIPAYSFYENEGANYAVEYGLGNTTSVASITLDAELQKYFSVDPITFDLMTKTDITRLTENIAGNITCIPSAGAVKIKERVFTVLRYNEVEPIVFVDKTHRFEENFMNTADRTKDFEWVATDLDKVDGTIKITYEIISQIPEEIFGLRSEDAGNFFVKKTVDYETTKQITMVVRTESSGLASDGTTKIQTTTATLIADVINVDDNEPQLEGCQSIAIECVPPFYKGYVSPGSLSGSDVGINPIIKITDVDALAGVTETYELYNADSTSSNEFEIDVSTGEVSLKKDISTVEQGTHYELVVVAKQDAISFYAYLDIAVNVEDTVAPTTVVSSTSGSITSTDSPGIVVDGSGVGITVSASDPDESDAQFAYEISSANFQVVDGVLYYFPTAVSSRATSETVSITSINLNAETSSTFRKSSVTTITVDTTSAAPIATPDPSTTSPGGIDTGETDNTTLIIVASVLSVIIVLLLCVILYLICKEKDKRKKVDSIVEGSIQTNNRPMNDYTNLSFKSEDEKSSITKRIETPNEDISDYATEVKYDYPESEVAGRKNYDDSNPNIYAVTLSDPNQGESTADHQSEAESTQSYQSSEHQEESHDFSDEPEKPAEEDEEEDLNEEVMRRNDSLHNRPPVIPMPPPPTIMFPEPPRTPLPDDDGASAIVNEYEGVILNFPLACQRNLCEHLRFLKEDQGATTELVSLKRFGIERKDTFAVVKNYELSQMFDHQIDTNKKLDQLMGKIGTSRNEYILQYYGQYQNEGFLRQSIEFVPNGSMNEFFKKDQRAGNSRMRMNFISGITKGLSFVHSNNIVHGKLSSYCIWIDENLIPKLHGYENNEGFQLDQTDEKRRWMAPEVLSGEISTKSSDIWSLGVVMWEVISGGETPYEGLDVSDIARYLEGEKRLSQPESCSREMFSLVEGGCWNFQPKGRLDAKIVQSNIDEKLLQDPEILIGANMEPKVNFSESHRVRFEDMDDITEF